MAEKKSDTTRLREAQSWIKDGFAAVYKKEICDRLDAEKACGDYGFRSDPIQHPSGVMQYSYKGIRHTYEIRPSVTAKGFTVETLFDGQPLTTESAKDIREWTKEKIIADFWAGHERWGRREPTEAEIMRGRMKMADMMRRRQTDRS